MGEIYAGLFLDPLFFYFLPWQWWKKFGARSDLKNGLCSIFYDEKYHRRSSNFFFNSVFRLSSPVGILRAVWIGGKGHPRDFGASLHDSLPNDYSRDTAAHGENTVDKWVPLVNDNYLGVNGSEAVEHRSCFNPAASFRSFSSQSYFSIIKI